jgi:myo-inositol-1(or 4)-monophosphatase
MERPEDLLEVAFEAARAGAKLLLEGYGRILEVNLKGAIDVVTQYDFDSEQLIRKIILRNFPSHSILAEEGGLTKTNSPYRWYVDPLDGTTNYTRSHPFFGVSVACGLIVPGRPPRILAGVILAPVLRETYWAYEGGGAYRSQELSGRGLIEEKIKVSNVSNLMESFICTGFPYDVATRLEQIVEPIKKFLSRIRALRRAGSAALDMAYVAAGRADGYFEYGPKAWDLAAGSLIVTEAGGVVSDITGEPLVLEHQSGVIAGTPPIHKELIKIVNFKNES